MFGIAMHVAIHGTTQPRQAMRRRDVSAIPIWYLDADFVYYDDYYNEIYILDCFDHTIRQTNPCGWLVFLGEL